MIITHTPRATASILVDAYRAKGINGLCEALEPFIAQDPTKDDIRNIGDAMLDMVTPEELWPLFKAMGQKVKQELDNGQ